MVSQELSKSFAIENEQLYVKPDNETLFAMIMESVAVSLGWEIDSNQNDVFTLYPFMSLPVSINITLSDIKELIVNVDYCYGGDDRKENMFNNNVIKLTTKTKNYTLESEINDYGALFVKEILNKNYNTRSIKIPYINAHINFTHPETKEKLYSIAIGSLQEKCNHCISRQNDYHIIWDNDFCSCGDKSSLKGSPVIIKTIHETKIITAAEEQMFQLSAVEIGFAPWLMLAGLSAALQLKNVNYNKSHDYINRSSRKFRKIEPVLNKSIPVSLPITIPTIDINALLDYVRNDLILPGDDKITEKKIDQSEDLLNDYWLLLGDISMLESNPTSIITHPGLFLNNWEALDEFYRDLEKFDAQLDNGPISMFRTRNKLVGLQAEWDNIKKCAVKDYLNTTQIKKVTKIENIYNQMKTTGNENERNTFNEKLESIVRDIKKSRTTPSMLDNIIKQLEVNYALNYDNAIKNNTSIKDFIMIPDSISEELHSQITQRSITGAPQLALMSSKKGKNINIKKEEENISTALTTNKKKRFWKR